MPSLSLTDPLLSRARELVDKHLTQIPTLWLKVPGDTPKHHPGSSFWQPWFPEHQRLLHAGWKSGLGAKWAQVVLFGGKQKEENWNLLKLADHHLDTDGKLLFVIPNEYGSKSYQRKLEESQLLSDYSSGRKSRLYMLKAQALSLIHI